MKRVPELIAFVCPTCGDTVYCMAGSRVRCPVCRTWYDENGETDRPGGRRRSMGGRGLENGH